MPKLPNLSICHGTTGKSKSDFFFPPDTKRMKVGSFSHLLFPEQCTKQLPAPFQGLTMAWGTGQLNGTEQITSALG